MKWIKPYKLFENKGIVNPGEWWGNMYHDPYGDGYRMMLVFNTLFNPLGITIVLDPCEEGVQLCLKIFINYLRPNRNPIFKTIFEYLDDKIKMAYPLMNSKLYYTFNIDYQNSEKDYYNKYHGKENNYRRILPKTEQETLLDIIKFLNSQYKNMDDEIITKDRGGMHITSPLSSASGKMKFPMAKNVILKYTDYLLSNPPSVDKPLIQDVPNELFKILLSEMEFSILNKIKGTYLYKELEKVGAEKVNLGAEMGDLGFS